MGYRLSPGAALPAELRRVCDEQARKAVDALTGQPDGLSAAVHDARKRCKKLRAALELGPRLFAEKPGALRRRLVAYWGAADDSRDAA